MRAPQLGAGCLALLCLAMSARTQVPQVPQLGLRVTATAEVGGTYANPTLSPVQCDASGNIYLRFYNPLAVFQAPVVRISRNGEAKRVFPLSSAPGFQQADISSFAIAPDGTVALAVWGPKVDDAHILMFKDDGTFDSDATIELGSRHVYQMAIFSSGNVLVTGTDATPQGGGIGVSLPFTQVLDDTGAIIKSLALPGDYKPPKRSDTRFEKSFGTQPGEITLGDAIPATDGNIYLTRRLGDYTVYVVGPDGGLVRRLQLVPPDGATLVGGIHYSAEGGGRLAITAQAQKGHRSARRIIVYSAETGERLIDYTASREIGDGLACYTPNSFTFIASTQQHRMAINEVRPD